MIPPTIGRVVWFHPDGCRPPEQPCAGTVAYVHDERHVNLGVLNPDGTHMQHVPNPVVLLQDDDPIPETGAFAMWMPYQRGQAAKTEAAEAAAAKTEEPEKEPAKHGHHKKH